MLGARRTHGRLVLLARRLAVVGHALLGSAALLFRSQLRRTHASITPLGASGTVALLVHRAVRAHARVDADVAVVRQARAVRSALGARAAGQLRRTRA